MKTTRPRAVWVTREQVYLAGGVAEVAAQGAGFKDAFLVLGLAGIVATTASALRGGKSPVAAREDVPSDMAVSAGAAVIITAIINALSLNNRGK